MNKINSKTQRVTIPLDNGFKDFIELCTKVSGRSITEFARLNMLNGFELLLCYIKEDLSNLDFILDNIERTTSGFSFNEKIHKIISVNKELKGGKN